MSEADLVRVVYPQHTMKRLARLMGVPLDTARHWLYRHFPAARAQELAIKLLRELDEKEAAEARARELLQAMAGDAGDGQMDQLLAGVDAGEDRLPATGPAAGPKTFETGSSRSCPCGSDTL